MSECVGQQVLSGSEASGTVVDETTIHNDEMLAFSEVGRSVLAVLETNELPTELDREMLNEWSVCNGRLMPAFFRRDPAQYDLGEVICITPDPDEPGFYQLHLPEDLTFAESIEAAHTVLEQTYPDRPEWLAERKTWLFGQADNFELAASYLETLASSSQPVEPEGAKATKLGVMQYVDSFRAVADALRPDLAAQRERGRVELTTEQVEKARRWLLGDQTYERLSMQIGNGELSIEDVEAKYVALLNEASPACGEHDSGPRGPFDKFFAAKVAKAIRDGMLAANPVDTVVFDRGVHELAIGIQEPHGDRKLYDVLNIDHLAKELKALRLSGASEFVISMKEIEIADLIQLAVTKYPYHEGVDSPPAILKRKMKNCVGATILAGRLMQMAGLEPLAAMTFEHSVNVVLTRSGDYFWRDCTEAGSEADNLRLSDSMFEIDPHASVYSALSHSNTRSKALILASVGMDLLNVTAPESDVVVGPFEQMGYSIIRQCIGNRHQQQMANDRAIYSYLAAIRVNGRDVNLLADLVSALHGNGDYELAAKGLEGTFALEKHRLIGPKLAELYYMHGDLVDAMRSLERYTEFNPGSQQALLHQGVILLMLGRMDEARQVFQFANNLPDTAQDIGLNFSQLEAKTLANASSTELINLARMHIDWLNASNVHWNQQNPDKPPRRILAYPPEPKPVDIGIEP